MPLVERNNAQADVVVLRARVSKSIFIDRRYASTSSRRWWTCVKPQASCVGDMSGPLSRLLRQGT